MNRPTTTMLAASLLASATGILGGVVSAPSAYAAETCQGQPATIVGTQYQVLTGTEGNDVIVTNGARSTTALGGDDLICITGTAGGGTSVYAGAGNDVVDASATASNVIVELGAGSDTYLGTPLGESVTGGTASYATGVDADTEKDTITTVAGGWDFVRSGTDGAVPNHDVVTVAGEGSVSWTGPLGEGGRLAGDNDSTLMFDVGSGAVAVDSGAGTMSEEGATLLRWTGFGRYDIDGPADHAPRSFTFTGTDRDEQLSLEFEESYRRPQKVSLGGGNDSLLLGGEDNMGRKGSSYDGGAGTDYVATWVGPKVSFDLASGRMERRQHGKTIRTSVDGFENSLVGAKKLKLWGTGRANDLHFYSCQATVHARGGNDDVQLSKGDDYFEGGLRCDPWRFELYGEGGKDVLRGSFGRDLLIGGAGRDVIYGNSGRDTCSGEKLHSCEVRRR